MAQTPAQEIETTYGLYTIEDLSPTQTLQDKDLLIVNVLNTSTSRYTTGRMTIKDFVDYVGATLQLGGVSPTNVYEKGDIMAALNNSSNYDEFKEYMMSL